MFPCCKCDKLLSSERALNDHKRKSTTLNRWSGQSLQVWSLWGFFHKVLQFIAPSKEPTQFVRQVSMFLLFKFLGTSQHGLNNKNGILAMFLFVDQISKSPICSISQLKPLILISKFFDSSLRTMMLWSRSTTLFLRKIESLLSWILYWA